MSKKGTELKSSVVSVLIGHVFGFSAENVNIPFLYAWIAPLFVGFGSFLSVDFCCEFYFPFCCVFHLFILCFSRHVLGKMATSPPRRVFAHKRTVRLIIEEDMRINALQVIASLPDFQADITSVVPLFGGKRIDITLRDHEVAARLAASGFDYGDVRKPLRLLGEKPIHVSCFVSVEFPDNVMVDLLKQYGELKTENLRRLYFQEEGFSHIECGIRVAEFIKINRDLPRRIVTQGVEINFKYTGQPITCYRCNSTEHVVHNCDKQRRVRPTVNQPTANQRLAASGGGATPGPPIPTTDTEETTNDDMDHNAEETTESSESTYAQISDPNQELSPSLASRDLFDTSPQSRKRPPSSPAKSDNPEPKQQRASSANASRDPSFKFLYTAAKQAGTERKKLMITIPGPQYYHCCALYLQHHFGPTEPRSPQPQR